MSDERTSLKEGIGQMAEASARVIVRGMREVADEVNLVRLQHGCEAMNAGELFSLVTDALQLALADLFESNARTVIDLIQRIGALEAVNGGEHVQ
jgi:hypothetical protein